MPNAKTTLVGSLDELHAVRPAHHRLGTIVRCGEKAVVRGWVGTSGHRTIKRVFIDAGDAGGGLQRVAYGFRRADVAGKMGVRFLNAGFEGTIDIADDAGPQLNVFVRCIVDDDKYVSARSTIHRQAAVVARAQTLSLNLSGTAAPSRIRRLTDELPGEPFFGRSRRSVRAGAPVEVSGWILDRTGRGPGKAAALVVQGAEAEWTYRTQRCFDGEAAAIAGSDVEAGFRALIDLGSLPVGLYAAIPVVAESDGSWSEGQPVPFERCSPDDRAPNFLPMFKQPALSQIERLGPLRAVRGEPIVISGWASGPPGTGRARGIYARLGDHHFLPLPSALARPDVSGEHPALEREIGFAGIIDTAHVLPGVHHLDVVLSDAAGRGWYPIASNDVEVV
jgi:hypothetical protein